MATAMGTHVSDYILGQDDSKAGEIAKDLYARNVSLVQVVESLGEYLTSENVDHRRRGTGLMAEILQKLPSDFLSEKEVGHVTSFLLNKLSDHHSVQPLALHGLAAVTGFAGFRDAEASRQVCREVFREVQNQSLSQRDRQATYTLLYNLLTLHLPAVLSQGDSFVCGYVQQMDGEKDPRNLMLAFRCSLVVCRHLPLGTMEEEMFEVNSCYFPVDFVPPPNDPHGITRDDLSDALRQVMSSTPAFAKYCYPLLLEKLASDVASAKLEALKTLGRCLAVYESKDLQEFLTSFTGQLIKEVRTGASEELLNTSLQALTGIAAQLSQVPQQLQDFMADTGASLVRQVESDNTALRLSATRVLCAMAAANGQVCHAVAARLVPAVCGVCHNMSSQLEQHTAFFTEVTSLLQLVADSHSAVKDWSILQDQHSNLVQICDRLLTASDDPLLQALGMRGLLALLTGGAGLTPEEIVHGLDILVSRALVADSEALREEGRKAVSRVVQYHTHLSETVISRFSEALQNSLATYSDAKSKDRADNSASLLSAVAVDGATGERVCQELLPLLQSYRTGHEDAMVPVSSGLSQVLGSGHLSPIFLRTSLLPSMLHFLWPGCASWPDEKRAVHVSVLSQLVDGVRSAVLRLDQQASKEIVGHICGLIVNGGGGDDGYKDCSLLKATSPWQQTRLVQLLLSVIPRLDLKTNDVAGSILSQLPDLALKAEDAHTHSQACRCVASLLNKMTPGPPLDSCVKELCGRLTSDLHQSSDPDLQERTLNLLAWVTKAMVVRGHRLSAELTSQLASLLSDAKLGAKAAEGFHLILTPFSDVLCTAVGASVTPTFQQRFLVQNLPSLLAGFRGTQNEVRENYLLAMVGMLTSVPQQVLVTELPQLMPVLASSLKGSNSSLHMEALRALTAGLKHSPELLTTYLSDVLPDCLKLATAAPSMHVRILAVRCVGDMVHLPSATIQPHKSTIVRSLRSAIDDPKRLVRREAVEARTAWCLL